MHWRLPHAAAAVLTFAAALIAVAALTYGFSQQVSALADRLPSAAQELREAIQTRRGGNSGTVAKVQEAANELQKLSGADTPVTAAQPKIATVAIEKKPFDLGDYLWEGSLSVTTFIGDTIVVLFLALYLLLAGDMFRRRFVEIAGPTLTQKKITLQILDAIALQVSRYLFVRAVISLIVGVGTFFAFWAMGLQQPIVWGVAAGCPERHPLRGTGGDHGGSRRRGLRPVSHVHNGRSCGGTGGAGRLHRSDPQLPHG